MKPTGERNAGNPQTTFEVAGSGNRFTVRLVSPIPEETGSPRWAGPKRHGARPRPYTEILRQLPLWLTRLVRGPKLSGEIGTLKRIFRCSDCREELVPRALPIRVAASFALKTVVVGVAELSIFVAICGLQLRGQQRPNFSGYYIHRADQSVYIPNSHTVRLTVTQNAETLDVVMTFEGGKSTTSHYALDGTETSNITAVGVPTKDRAKFKGKRLIITMQASDGSFEMSREWKLSSDLQTLIVKTLLHYPADWNLDRSSSDKYSREQ